MAENKHTSPPIIALRPATLADKRAVFEWLAHSDLTHQMLGPPVFPDNLPPTWEEFNNDYFDWFFEGSKPLQGSCFIILFNGEPVGQINYNDIDTTNQCTELDIWLSHSKHTGKGYGTHAIILLCHYLKETFDLKRIYIGPSQRNVNAIRAYEKVGFVETSVWPEHFIPDYHDTVVLVKELE